MPRVQVYLPDDLHRAVEEYGLSPSKLLQEAVLVEIRRRQLREETDRYLAELRDEVGEPSAEDYARAKALARRTSRRDHQARSGISKNRIG